MHFLVRNYQSCTLKSFPTYGEDFAGMVSPPLYKHVHKLAETVEHKASYIHVIYIHMYKAKISHKIEQI